MLFRFTQEQAGTEDGDQYWYVAEQITPVTDTIGTTFARGQPVAHFAACGTGIEIGWGSPTSGQRTLAGADGGRGSREPRGRLAHPVGRELQAVVSDARLVDRHLTLT